MTERTLRRQILHPRSEPQFLFCENHHILSRWSGAKTEFGAAPKSYTGKIAELSSKDPVIFHGVSDKVSFLRPPREAASRSHPASAGRTSAEIASEVFDRSEEHTS